MLRRRFLQGGTAALGMAGCASFGAQPTLIDKLDIDEAPGASVAVVRQGSLLALGGKGAVRRGVDLAPAPNGDTLFEIGSVTKTFTAALIWALHEEGRLDATDAIGRWVDDLPADWRETSLEQLLAHTSGLPNYLTADNAMLLMPQDLQPRQLLEIAAEQPRAFPAGERHEYNNTGYILLGMAAEAVSGSGYWDLLERRFFRPAGMRSTGPRSRLPRGGEIASGHFWNGTAWTNDPPISAPGSTWAAGGLLSTAADLARWAQAIDRGDVLSAQVRERMWRPAPLNDGSPSGWGYGWKYDDGAHGPVVSHGGGTAGFSCWLQRDVTRALTTIILTNQNGSADPQIMTDRLLASLETV